MLIDALDLPPATTLHADVCIVGSGPAGLTIARELSRLPLNVLVLESGGAGPEPGDLPEVMTHSPHRLPDAARTGRLRQFGGTSNGWIYDTRPGESPGAARMIAPRPIDFEAREGVPSSGWPFSLADLAPFYRRAERVLGIGPFDRLPEHDAAGGGFRPLPLDPGLIDTVMCQYGNFSSRIRQEVAAAAGVTVLLHATAAGFGVSPAGHGVERVWAIDPVGRQLTVRARCFVLAAGGIENARLLLASDEHRLAGLGNAYGLVGRCLMEHPEFRLGVIAPRENLLAEAGLYDLHWVDGVLVSGMLALSQELLRREQLLNLGMLLVPQPLACAGDVARSLKALLTLRRGDGPATLIRHLRTVAGHPWQAWTAASSRALRARLLFRESRGGWSHALPGDARLALLEVVAATEQAPDPDNRVVLSRERDRFGQRKAVIEWCWGERERRTIRRARCIMNQAVFAAGVGVFHPWVNVEDPRPPLFKRFRPAGDILGGFHHPMGTTRMHSDPRYGVVDGDCRLHEAGNLFVAGSSVFPTGGGFANPTLTIVALALRLAGTLSAELRAPAYAVRSSLPVDSVPA